MDENELQGSIEITDDEHETILNEIRIVLLGRTGAGPYLVLLSALGLTRFACFRTTQGWEQLVIGGFYHI